MFKYIILSVAAVCTCIHVSAQDSLPQKKEAEITVTAFRFPENKLKIPFTTQQIKNTGWNMQAPSMAEVLQNSGFVNVQKSQGGGGSPVIRGFEASRILLMVDGVRLNNAIYRAGHLQNIITVDANALQQVDILYGPSSTQYGSDALGGVIHMRTKKPTVSPLFDKTKIAAQLNSRYSSALNELQQHIDFSIAGKKMGSFTSFTNSSFGDLRQGANRASDYASFGKRTFYVNTVSGRDYLIPNTNVNKQIGTAYNQTDFIQKLLYKPNANQEHLINVQVSNSSNIQRYDRLTELAGANPRFAEWYYGPQKRFMASYQINQEFAKRKISKLTSTLAYQAIEESRYDRRFDNVIKSNRIENVHVLSYTIDAFIPTKNGDAHIGAEIQHNTLNSEAFSSNIVTDRKQYNIAYRYPDGKNRMTMIAAYAQQLNKLTNHTTLSYGMRITTTTLLANIINNAVMQFPFTKINQQNSALVGNVGVTHVIDNKWKLSAAASNGFRTPNFDELKVFDSRPGFLIVPNQNIKPEYSYNAEINANKFSGKFQTEAAIFYTLLRNAIQISKSTFNGSTTINYLGSPAQVQMAINSGKGFMTGASAMVKYNLTNKVTAEAMYTYTYGRIDSAGALRPLDHVAPTYGRVAITHKAIKWNMQLYTLFNGWKRLKNYSTSGEDNLQYATINGTPSWYTINVKSFFQLQPKIALLLGIENILDRNYRVFASGVSAAGRNFIISLTAAL